VAAIVPFSSLEGMLLHLMRIRLGLLLLSKWHLWFQIFCSYR